MMDETKYRHSLVQRFAENKCTEEELEVFFHLLNQGNLNEYLSNDMERQAQIEEEPISIAQSPRLIRWGRYAAAVIILIASGIMLKLSIHDVKKVEITKSTPSDIKAPSSSRATIKLSNGQIVYLDSVANGHLAKQGEVNITKLADGRIVYTGFSSEPAYNTLTNPKGSKVIDMKLADGSWVWLNSGSSVTYPVAFAEKERKVTITGEAYFEVAKNAAKPFKVSVGKMEIEVLGTHFNVNGYDDESVVRTTLLEGSVRITRNNTTKLLKPGQQAQLNRAGEFSLVNNADMEEAIAWKEGNFQFENTDIDAVMRQIARWYNVEVQYQGSVEKHFVGAISRDVNLSQALNMLQQTGKIKFSVEGNKVIVMP